jgi:hypothetical protein
MKRISRFSRHAACLDMILVIDILISLAEYLSFPPGGMTSIQDDLKSQGE